MHHLAKRVKAHYAASERERDWPIVNLKWDYPECGEMREPDVEAVIKEINGYDVATGRPVSSFDELRERRLDRLRLLDLLRHLQRRRQSGAPAPSR